MSDRVINSPVENRPKTFSDVVGQPFARGVGKMIGKGNVSGQGYILAGQKGCGKTTVARIIAKSLNCEHRDIETGDPCNSCASCISIDNDTNPLVTEINAASRRGIGDIREALQSINYSVNKGYRIYILDEIHMLTKEAFSILLKPMEEPPENVVFIAATTSPESIPDTIVSRIPIIPIVPLSNEELRHVLQNAIQQGLKDDKELWGAVTQDDVEAAILSAQGSARQALTNLSGKVFHGVSYGSTLKDTQDIICAFKDGSIPAVLSSSLEVLSVKENDPLVVVSQIMSGLIELLKSDKNIDVEKTSREVAKLSQVSQEISRSSQPTLIAARIASCVCPSNKQGKKNAPKGTSGTSSPLTENKVLNILFSSRGRSVLGEYWMTILDDPDRSEIEIKNGTVKILVENPKKDLHTRLTELFDQVVVEKMN